MTYTVEQLTEILGAPHETKDTLVEDDRGRRRPANYPTHYWECGCQATMLRDGSFGAFPCAVHAKVVSSHAQRLMHVLDEKPR